MLHTNLKKLHNFTEKIIESLEEELMFLRNAKSKEGMQQKKAIADILCKLTKMLAQLGKLDQGSPTEAAEAFNLTDDDQQFLNHVLAKLGNSMT